MLPSKNYLNSVDVFKNLSPEVLQHLDNFKIEKRYEKNEVLNLEGELAGDVWFVRMGRVRSVRHLSNGQDLILTTIGPNILFGVCCSFSEAKYHCDHVADIDSVVVRVAVENLKDIMSRHNELALSIIENLSSRLHMARRVQTMDHEKVEKRLMYTLRNLKAEVGDTIHLTKRELAEMAGTTVETCIRQMSIFEKKGLITTSRGLISVRNLGEEPKV